MVAMARGNGADTYQILPDLAEKAGSAAAAEQRSTRRNQQRLPTAPERRSKRRNGNVQGRGQGSPWAVNCAVPYTLASGSRELGGDLVIRVVEAFRLAQQARVIADLDAFAVRFD